MIRRLVLAATLAAALVMVAPATQAQAFAHCQTNQTCTTSYYSDGTLDVIVGQSIANHCNGASSSWGTTTRYLLVTAVFC
jgi:hypothetical protein